ncbi:KH domain-containing protein [Bacillus mangrovi]|uniref:RNA-binding protein KhpB n=1 Tax=Metabacillus mangrovi TaxID=1491830 RepID=A0A7X2V5H3_9BACI|nr:RNA-binding cell elongation regulator Jag/EloR [Metabacillus mangrovi]MTH54164.1 KH domain-containing protein [Metabacillus mangrovi]
MNEATAAGSNVEEAVSAALKLLKASREEVTIEVLSEGRRGFLGFGKKEARVRVVLSAPEQTELPKVEEPVLPAAPDTEEKAELPAAKPENHAPPKAVSEVPGEEAHAYLKSVVEQMGVKATVEKIQKGRNLTFLIEGENMALLIGKRGQTLNSLQYLTQLAANRHSDQYFHVTVDAESYRQRREESLVQLAGKLAGQALSTSKEVALEPMPSNERKIIHAALARNRNVSTYSAGEEPRRYIVIVPKK